MITAKAFLKIESALSQRINKALSLATQYIYPAAAEALALGSRDRAMQEINTLQLSPLRGELQEFVEYLTSIAMLFGASRVSQQPGTSVVGMGFEQVATKQMADTFLTAATLRAETYIKRKALEYIMQPDVLKADAPKERILQPFASFMDDKGKAYMNTISALHTSRVSAYGYTAEALALGFTEYQINEQLDNRTCPVCQAMHGKTFKVTEARQTLEVVCRTSDPDELKALQPWPPQTKEGIAKIRAMTNDELVQANWHIPPFHPGCRGLLGRAGKAPPLDQVVSNTVPDKYDATKEDFAALKVSANPEQLKLWNANVRLAPAEVVARLTGQPTDEFLAGLMEAAKPREFSGLHGISMGKNITITIDKQVFGSSEVVHQAVRIIPKEQSLNLMSFAMGSESQGAGVAKKYLREVYALTKDMGLKKMELVAGLEHGGYAWAKYGFKPTASSWKALQSDLASSVADLTPTLSQFEKKALNAIMQSSDPAAIYLLSDMSVGKKLLMGRTWAGELELSDSEAVIRFLTYIGELK